MEEAQKCPLPRVAEALVKLPSKNTLPWVSPGTWGGLVDGRGHRKGQQLRVLGSPSALRTKKPRTGGPLAGWGQWEARGPDFFFAKAPWYIPKGTPEALKPACRPAACGCTQAHRCGPR
jgi:hypothetical protein